VRFNGEWFSKYAFLDVLNLMSKITMQRMLERDDFTKRREKGEAIYLHECLYPLMQGQDSVDIRADVELGGSEQLFNLMVGRDLQRDAGQEPQVCLTLPLLLGPDGVRKMGKSLGNYIGVGEPAYDQFAKTMSIPDTLMRQWFELLTDWTAEEIARLTDANTTHPRQAKETLGKDIAKFYHGETAANDAAAEWKKRFSERQDPTDISGVPLSRDHLTDGKMLVVKLLVALGLAKSGNEARRLVEGGGVNIGAEREKITDPNRQVTVANGLIVRVGSKRIVRVQLT
jgi:tyrosyl-tRNA synthetase